MKLGWLSDIHLNFLSGPDRGQFFDDLSALEVDGWLVTGDIGEAESVSGYLGEFSDKLAVPTYFVLGNHDFYNGSMAQLRAEVSAVSASSDKLVWLTELGPTWLGDDVVLVGDDGWADGRLGNPMNTPVELNDFHLIEELSNHSRADLVHHLNRLGDESAARLHGKLNDAAAACTNVIVALHVPPYEGATWHEGEISSPDWLPWFSCEAAGLALASVASAHPDTNFTVFCGHTHSGGEFSPSSNVTVYTAYAEYGRPKVQAVIELANGDRPRMV